MGPYGEGIEARSAKPAGFERFLRPSKMKNSPNGQPENPKPSGF